MKKHVYVFFYLKKKYNFKSSHTVPPKFEGAYMISDCVIVYLNE
jgi:hypothetical protein